MTKYFISAALLFSLFLVSCNGSNQFIEEDYKNGNQPGSLSLLTIQEDEFNGDFSDHTFGSLRSHETPIFENYLTSLSSGTFNAEVRGTLTRADFKESNFERREFDIKSGNFKALIPTKGTVLKEESTETRYVIILDRFRFEQYEEIVGNDSYTGHEPEIIPHMNFKTNYVIWDNEKRDAIGWGEVEANREIELSRIQEIYNELLSESFKKMIQQSPFTAQV